MAIRQIPKPVDLSAVKEPQVKRVDKNTVIRYRVVGEKIDLAALRRERAELEEMLRMQEPSKEELLELGKSQHPYYWDKTAERKRIAEIDAILKAGA